LTSLQWDGVFFHNSRNLAFEGGIVANNEIQIDLDRAENIRVSGTTLIGVSDEFKAIIASQGASGHTDYVYGLELHGFTTNMDRSGATVRDVSFSGFSDTGSSRSALITIDNSVEHGHFDFWTTLQGLQQLDGDITPRQFEFTRAKTAGTSGIYITDLDSSMRPSGSTASGVSTVISDTPEITHFLDTGNCVHFPEQSYMYCPNTCLRTILYSVDPAETHDFVLRVTEVENANNRFDYPPKYYYETIGDGGPLDDIANSWIRKGRYFAVTLPAGKEYVARFRDGSGQAWPTHAEVTVEDAQCPGAISRDAVGLVPPPASQAECQELIRNGDLEMSNSAFPYWLHHQGGIELARGKGRGGSNAITDVDQSMSNRLIGQYLDTRCLVPGKQYVLQAWIKLERNGTPISCDLESGCPIARLKVRVPVDEEGSRFDEINMNLADYFVRPYQSNGWNLLQGVFTVESIIAGGSSVLFFIEPRITRVNVYIDDVSVSLLPEDCSELVLNGDFSDGSSRFWEKNVNSGSVDMSIVGGGDPALVMTGRSSLSHSPLQYTRIGCMSLNERFLVTARFRLLNKLDGSLFVCNPTRPTGNSGCPRLKMRSFINLNLPSQDVWAHDGGSIAVTDQGITPDGWYTVSGTFNANEYDANGDQHQLFFDQVSSGKDFVIDDVSITPMPLSCNQLVLNGDAEYGPTASFWRHWSNFANAKIELISMGGSKAFKISNRENQGDGMHQFVDARCLELNSRWKLTAKMRLVHKVTGAGVTCDPADARIVPGCPPIRLAGWNGNSKTTDQKVQMSNRITWAANAFNPYEAEFTVNSALANADRVAVAIRQYNFDWDLIVDDIALIPV
jgi:hypothetical protein